MTLCESGGMADALVSKSSKGDLVGVQVPPLAPTQLFKESLLALFLVYSDRGGIWMNWGFIQHLEQIDKLLNRLNALEIERDYPITWERVHVISCAQLGRLLARERGVDIELAALACSLHDIGRWYTGRQANHALHGEEPVREFLKTMPLSEEQKEEILQAVIHHSEKEKVGTPLGEVVKDADILDCYLHGDEITKPFHLARLEKLIK